MTDQIGPNGEVKRGDNSLLWWGVLAVVFTGVAVLFWLVSNGDLMWPERTNRLGDVADVVAPGDAGEAHGAGEGDEIGQADAPVKVFGLTLGAPLDLPLCVTSGIDDLSEYSGPMCYSPSRVLSERTKDFYTGLILFSQNRPPQFSIYNFFLATVNDGRLKQLALGVAESARPQLFSGLRAHYGEPLEAGVATGQESSGLKSNLLSGSYYAIWEVGQVSVFYGENVRPTGLLKNTAILVFSTIGLKA